MNKILIVEDSSTDRYVLTRLLEQNGYLVESVSSGAEALIACKNNPPDLVVSDLSMPSMDGREFCRRLRATPSGQLMPFIFLSGLQELETRISSHAHGADAYLTKPVNRRELLALIKALLERERRIQTEITRLTQLSISKPNQLLPRSTASLSAPTATSPGVTPSPLPLTPAERRVFWEVIRGFSNKQIGERLLLSPRTVQGYVSSILHQLELNNRSQLIHYAYSQGLISPKPEQSSDDDRNKP